MARRTEDLLPFPVQSWFVSHMKRAAARTGRTDVVSLWGGQAAPNLRHHTASDVMTSLLEETRS
jgi:nitronate monooxygenase